MEKQGHIAIVAADVTREGLVVHFSDRTASLFNPDFLYAARHDKGNVLLLEQGETAAGSPIAGAMEEDVEG